jgi:hypothetical protein
MENDNQLADWSQQIHLEQEQYEKEKDDHEFIAIIQRQIKDRLKRRELYKTYFGDNNGTENFGDC